MTGNVNVPAFEGGEQHAAEYVFNLPWPPSANTLYRAYGGRNILSRRGREFYAAGLRALVPQQLPPAPLRGLLCVTVFLHPPTRRAYDVDNRAKGVLDLLTKAGVWKDDVQVMRLVLEKAEQRKGGAAMAIVRLEATMPYPRPLS